MTWMIWGAHILGNLHQNMMIHGFWGIHRYSILQPQMKTGEFLGFGF